MNKRPLLVFFPFVACLLAFPSHLDAVTFVRLADENLTDQAVLIIEARALSIDPSPGIGRPVTDYEFAIDHTLKGRVEVSPLVVRVPGGLTEDGAWRHLYGAPRFALGEQVLLFLKPWGDGSYAVLHFMQGAFRLSTIDGRTFAWRHFEESTELPGVQTLPLEMPRHLALFRSWIEDRNHGLERPSNYLLNLGSNALETFEKADKFTLLIGNNGLGFRWREFDNNQNVRFAADIRGQPGLANGGFEEFRAALRAWTDESNSNIRYVYGGTTTSQVGFRGLDGINAILFDDPNGNFDSPYNCLSGGVLAAAGPAGRGAHFYRGQQFNTTSEADIVTNRGLPCTIRAQRIAEEIFAHELGHTLGLGHSCGGSSGPCNTNEKNQAQMRATVHRDNRGASLRSDDKAAISFLYSLGGSIPAPPTNLSAAAPSGSLVQLAWVDGSSDENEFEIERRLEGMEVEFQEIAATSANTTTYDDTTASSGNTYRYRIRARNGAGTSAYSNQATATTPGELAPANLTARPVSTTEIRLDWTDQALDEEAYEVEALVEGGTDFQLLSTLPANTTSSLLGGLENSTTYTFRVRTLGGAGTSSYSNEAATTTLCVVDHNTLCLNSARFRVRVRFEDFEGSSGMANAVPIVSNDSGVMYFFEADNWELLVKIIDACGFNQNFWVFSAATTNLGYSLEVIDTWSGARREYNNPLGQASPAITDNAAFATCDALPPPGNFEAPLEIATAAVPTSGPTPNSSGFEPAGKAGTCAPSTTVVCLDQGRFQVEVLWTNFEAETGNAQVVPDSLTVPGVEDSALLYFFEPDNWEMLIKVINGCDFNGHYWVFAAATTNVAYTIKVTDTETGVERLFENALGISADATTDTMALATCP